MAKNKENNMKKEVSELYINNDRYPVGSGKSLFGLLIQLIDMHSSLNAMKDNFLSIVNILTSYRENVYDSLQNGVDKSKLTRLCNKLIDEYEIINKCKNREEFIVKYWNLYLASEHLGVIWNRQRKKTNKEIE